VVGVAVLAVARSRAGGGASARDAGPSRPAAPAHGALAGVADVAILRSRSLSLPIPGIEASALRDSFEDARAGGAHEAIDIPAPRGTPVAAVEDGTVARIFRGARGGLTVYQFDPTATYCYYYAHLDRYAPGLTEGAPVRRGDLLGFVGTTGNAPPDAPHLHFAISRLGAPPRWWQGVPVNPYLVWSGPKQGQ
jgi:murein DD-endopeptidase MepM/ murein hydrolase activator NlpD